MTPSGAVAWVAVLTVLATTGPGFGQTTRSAPPGNASEHEDAGVLAGPTVPGDAETGPAFEPTQRAGRATVVPLKRWLGVFNSLDLTGEQRAEAQDILKSWRETRNFFQKTHGRRLDGLQQQFRRSRRQGESMPEDLLAEMERLRGLAPPVIECQERMWALLDDAQQERMRTQLAEIRRQIETRRAEQRSSMTPPTDRPPDGFDAAGRRRLAFLQSLRQL